MVKFGSRKFIALVVQIILMIALPLAFKSFDIDGTITITVLVAVSGCVAAYTGFNVLNKKVISENGGGISKDS